MARNQRTGGKLPAPSKAVSAAQSGRSKTKDKTKRTRTNEASRASLEDLKKEELVAKCKELGLRTSGSKAELVERLKNSSEDIRPEKALEEEPLSQMSVELPSGTESERQKKLEALSYRELQHLCREECLPATGRKETLIERLLASEDDKNILLCDNCDGEFHINELDPPLLTIPEGDWFCTDCTKVKLPHEDKSPNPMETTSTEKESTTESDTPGDNDAVQRRDSDGQVSPAAGNQAILESVLEREPTPAASAIVQSEIVSDLGAVSDEGDKGVNVAAGRISANCVNMEASGELSTVEKPVDALIPFSRTEMIREERKRKTRATYRKLLNNKTQERRDEERRGLSWDYVERPTQVRPSKRKTKETTSMSVEAEDAVKPVVPATTMELPVMGKRKIEDTKDRGTRRNDLIKEKSEKRKEQQRMRTRAKAANFRKAKLWDSHRRPTSLKGLSSEDILSNEEKDDLNKVTSLLSASSIHKVTAEEEEVVKSPPRKRPRRKSAGKKSLGQAEQGSKENETPSQSRANVLNTPPVKSLLSEANIGSPSRRSSRTAPGKPPLHPQTKVGRESPAVAGRSRSKRLVST